MTVIFVDKLNSGLVGGLVFRTSKGLIDYYYYSFCDRLCSTYFI